MTGNPKDLKGLLAKLCRAPHWALAGLGLVFALAYGTGTSTSETPETLILVTRLALALIIVLGVLYLGVRLLQNTKGWLPNAHQRMIILQETLALGPRRTLYLVRVGQRQFLVGATEHNLTLISEITEGTQQATPAATTNIPESTPIPFTSLLTKHLTDIPETQ